MKKKNFYYEERINIVINYISKNLDSELTLDTLSKVSHFSKYHFARIFTAFVGESVNSFVKRIRIEKAAYLLAFNPDQPVTDIALGCGFSSSQNFSKNHEMKHRPHF